MLGLGDTLPSASQGVSDARSLGNVVLADGLGLMLELGVTFQADFFGVV